MVFSTVIIVGLAKELPGDRGPGRGRRHRLPPRRVVDSRPRIMI